ncbi:MAG: TetR/AcrR family transcriptional regulator [Acidimicrobiales bacterium]
MTTASDNAERLLLVTLQAGAGGDSPPQAEALLPSRSQLTGTARRLHEAALVLFGQRGYHAVSVRDIATAVGVKASSIYAHVPSKQHLLTELVRLGHAEHRDALRLALLESGSAPDDQLAVLTRAHVVFHAAFPLLARVCNRELGSLAEEDRLEILGIRLEAERLFFDVIDRGQRLGAFRPVDSVLAVAAIGAMGLRVADWWHPDLELPANVVADTYAEFALCLVSGR